MPVYSRPRPITAADPLDDFNCGEAELDTWLKKRALGNEAAGASRTYVTTLDNRIVGYYALTVGSLEHAQAPGKVRRNMPEPIPVAILARLAVDTSCQGAGLGGELLLDAIARVITAADIFGIRALLIHALSEKARDFYQRYDFVRSPTDDMMLMATLADLRKALN